MKPSLIAVLFLSSFVFVEAMRKQGVAVKGQLLCDGLPLKNVKVKIFDVDRNPGDSDDLLDEKVTDARGFFHLDGTTRELTTIEPELRAYHDCNDDIKPCRRRYVHKIPVEYIHHGTAEKVYDFGAHEMGLNVPKDSTIDREDRSCTDDE